MYIQVPQVVLNLVFLYSRRVTLAPILQSIDSRGARREVSSEDLVKNIVEYLSLLLLSWYDFGVLVHQGAYGFFNLHLADSFIVHLPVCFLVQGYNVCWPDGLSFLIFSTFDSHNFPQRK